MSRIRTIKPEFWSSVQIVECSPSARLLFVGLWNFCDDAGRHPACLRRLKMEVFPGDPFTIDQIGEWVAELVDAKLLVSYVVDSKGFWQVTGWHHQKIDRPTIRYPSPQEGSANSTNTRRTLAEPSPPESKGRESKGRESKKGCSEPAAPASKPTPAIVVFPIVGKGKKTWDLTAEKLGEFEQAFPALDVLSEFARAKLWLATNPEKKKTSRGMPAFLGRWLGKAQDNGGGSKRRSEIAGGLSRGLDLGDDNG